MVSSAQWDKATEVLKSMLLARGFERVEDVVWEDDEEEDAGTWFNACGSKEGSGSACDALGVETCLVYLLPSTGCIGKSSARKIVGKFEERGGGALPGSCVFVHSSRLSSDALHAMECAGIQVFPACDLQFDRLRMLKKREILCDVKVCAASEAARDSHTYRRWLSDDPMSKYFCLQPGMVVSWRTGEERRRAIVVTPPPFNV